MATNIRTPGMHVAKASHRSELPTPVIALALVMAIFGIIGVKILDFTPLGLAAVPLVFCAFARPQFFLTLAIAFVPYVYSLTGESYAGTKIMNGGASGAAFGISDVLLALAVPGLLARAISNPRQMRLGKMNLPVFLFLFVGLASFLVNFPLMHGIAPSYFVAFVRSAQIILVLPLAFLAIDWTPDDLRNILRAYLTGATILGMIGVGAFIGGMRSGLYILGNHKNGTGLALALAVLIAATLLTQPQPTPEEGSPSTAEPININRQLLILSLTICTIGLLCALSRGAYLCTLVGLLYISIVRRRGRLFGIILVLATVGMATLIYILPEKSVEYVKDLSAKNANNHTRIDQSELALKRFRDNYFLGDGFRTRKDILPHNLEMTVLAETGLLGAAAFLWMTISQFQVFSRARKLFTGDPLRECLVIAFTACSVAILVQSQFDPYWRRGPLWIPWCGTGIVLAMVLKEMAVRRRVVMLAQVEADKVWFARRAERMALRKAEVAAMEQAPPGTQGMGGEAPA